MNDKEWTLLKPGDYIQAITRVGVIEAGGLCRVTELDSNGRLLAVYLDDGSTYSLSPYSFSKYSLFQKILSGL